MPKVLMGTKECSPFNPYPRNVHPPPVREDAPSPPSNPFTSFIPSRRIDHSKAGPGLIPSPFASTLQLAVSDFEILSYARTQPRSC